MAPRRPLSSKETPRCPTLRPKRPDRTSPKACRSRSLTRAVRCSVMSATSPCSSSAAGGEVFAISATCTHYGGPLAEGLIVGDTVRCPWHHACFSLRTGEALRAPALKPVACWNVETPTASCSWSASANASQRRTERARHETRRNRRHSSAAARPELPRRRCCAARGIRRRIVDDQRRRAPPYDRPNLSKDYLAGKAPEDWIPLFAAELLRQARHRAAPRHARCRPSIRRRSTCELSDGEQRSPTTRCSSRRAPSPSSRRSRAPTAARALSAFARRQPGDHRARRGRRERAVVIGASFIGLEVAASLRARGHRGPRRGAGASARWSA